MKKYKDIKKGLKDSIEYQVEIAKIRVVASLNELMSRNGFSQAFLARSLGVSEAQISKIMRADQNLTISTMVRLASATGTRLDISFKPSEPGICDIPKEAVSRFEEVIWDVQKSYKSYQYGALQGFVPSDSAKLGRVNGDVGACNEYDLATA